MGGSVFAAGLLAEGDLRRVIFDRDVPSVPGELPFYRLVSQGIWTGLAVDPSGRVAGLRLTLDAADRGRLTYFTRCLGQIEQEARLADGHWVLVHLAAGAVGDGPGHAAIALAAAGDIMAQYGRREPAEIAGRLGPIEVRAASRLRCESGPTDLRRHAGPGDVIVADHRLPYAKFFAVEEYDVAWRQFGGQMNRAATRAAFVSGDAVTVLPYDVARDRVLLVEQFRAGPHARGDAQPWLLEAIAGRIDAGESPEQAARREAVEEAGLTLGALLPVAAYYPSPGAMTEYIYSYVALTDLPDGSAGVFGVADEAEDIRGHLVSFDRLMDLVARGEIANAPLILTALWLQRQRDQLRHDFSAKNQRV